MDEAEKQGFFVGINNPLDVRRNTLECSREMIQVLQLYTKVAKLREDKIKRTQQLKTVVRELDLLFTRLRSTLPKTHLRAKNVEEPNKSKLKMKGKVSLKELSELERLEEQLREVEQEITRLS
ncbi:MAG: hypothetical protein V1859_06575 [archaeon]